MSDEEPVFALPAEEVGVAPSSDEKGLILAVKAGGRAVAGIIEPLQTADLALKMLDWVSRATKESEQSLARRPLHPHGIYFDAGTDTHIVLAVDLGAATLRFELSHAQLGEALGQLKLQAGEPPKPN